MHTYNHWITDIEQPTTAKAFTYTIWFPELGQRYIGYKTISGGKNWLTYTSSSKPVKELINAGHKAIYRIIKWFDNADDARTEEISVLTAHKVTKRLEFLNQSIGGVKFSGGKKHTDETRAKLSAARKGKTRSAESIAKFIETRKGHKVSDETRAKLRAANIGKTLTPKHREALIAANKGKVHTPRSAETRAKMSDARKGLLKSAEHRAKISASHQLGLYVTPLGTFSSRKDAAAVHKCNPTTIGNRCNSTSPKFIDWSFIPNP